MIHLRTELLKIVRCLIETGIDYGLVGGLAVAVHGYVRATKDIDILIRYETLAQARDALAQIGYALDAGIFKFDHANAVLVQRIDDPVLTGTQQALEFAFAELQANFVAANHNSL